MITSGMIMNQFYHDKNNNVTIPPTAEGGAFESPAATYGWREAATIPY